MVHKGEVVPILAEVQVAPVLSNSDLKRHCSILNHFRPKEPILDRKLIMCSLGTQCKSHVLGGVLPELLFNQFMWILCITISLRMKERDSVRKSNNQHLATARSFPVGDYATAIK